MKPIKHQPGTQLPWSIGRYATTVASLNADGEGYAIANTDLARRRNAGDVEIQNAAYIAHAANVYPKLVMALRDLERAVYAYAPEVMGPMPVVARAGQLLAELGEGE